MPEVPVPETTNANDPSLAAKVRVSFARMSSISLTISGSRWLIVGAAMARMTRGEVALGPGPSRIRSLAGSRLMEAVLECGDRRADRLERCLGGGRQGRAGHADVVADHGERRLQSGNPIAGAAEQSGDRHQVLLQPARFVVTPV